jgi:hypothetical protein
MSNFNNIRNEYKTPTDWVNALEHPGTPANNRLLQTISEIEDDDTSAPIGYTSSAAMWAAKDKVRSKINAFKQTHGTSDWNNPMAASFAERILAAAYSVHIALATYLVALKNTASSVRNVPRNSPTPKSTAPVSSSPAAPAQVTPVAETPDRFDIDKSGFNWWILAALAAAWYFYRKGK